MSYKDISGCIYGKLRAIEIDWELTKEKKRTYWRCQCECGNIKSIRMDGLTSGRTKSCGECNNNYTNKKFGYLTALYKTHTDKFGHQLWMFQCDCGNQKEINIDNVKRGLTKSCGCLHSKICSDAGENLIGQTFYNLTVKSLYSISPRKYLCECKCGGIIIVEASNLKSGHTKSCGCLISYGESIINSYLKKQEVNFIKEYSVSINGFKKKARFDFAVLLNNKVKCLIEFHGKQHYEETNYGDLNERQEKDELKRRWAKDNSIPLYEIPYWELDNIESILEGIIKDTSSAPDMEEAQEVTEEG